MIIDRLSGINPLQNLNKSASKNAPAKLDSNDSVQISQDAIAMGELYAIAEQVKMAPDIRQDRVNDILKAIEEDPNFFSNEKLESVANKILESIFN